MSSSIFLNPTSPPRALTLAVSQPCLFYIFIGFYICTVVVVTAVTIAKVFMLEIVKLLETTRNLCGYISYGIGCVSQLGQDRLCCLGCKASRRLLRYIIGVLERGVLLLEHAIVLAECSMANCRNCVCVLDQSCGNAECANSSNNSNNSNKNISYGRNNGGHKDKIPDDVLSSFTGGSIGSQTVSGSESKTNFESDSVYSDSNSDYDTDIVILKRHRSSYSSNSGSNNGGTSGYNRDNSSYNASITSDGSGNIKGSISNNGSGDYDSDSNYDIGSGYWSGYSSSSGSSSGNDYGYVSNNGSTRNSSYGSYINTGHNSSCSNELKSAFRLYKPNEVAHNLAGLPLLSVGNILHQDAQSSVVIATTEIFGQIWDHPSNYWNNWGWQTLSKWMEKIVHDLNERRFRYGRLYECIDQTDIAWAHSVLQMAYDSWLVQSKSHMNTFDYAWSPEEDRPEPRVFRPWTPPNY